MPVKFSQALPTPQPMNATLLAVVIKVATASASNHHAAKGRASASLGIHSQLAPLIYQMPADKLM